MSKQYLTTHTIDDAHPTDIFSFAVTPNRILSASGASSIKVHDTTSTTDITLAQNLPGAHKLGCHHIVTSRSGKKAASAGFDGEVKIWSISESGKWEEEKKVVNNNKAGETWAIALSEDGQYLASTTFDGRINVWDLATDTQTVEYETKGSFGMCVDISRDGKYTASGHENGGVYVFDNETRRMNFSLPGMVKPVRAVAFSPLGSLLAAVGDARTIALYDVKNGEQVMNLTGHSAWIFSVDWSDTGDYLLTGSFDGKVKVWSVDRRACVYTHSGDEKTLWCVKWLPKTGKSEAFAIAGANRSITFFREATGG